MALDPSIILAGRQANILGAMEQGNALARQTGQLQTENALRQVYSQHGPGIARGETNALNALAGIDPMGAFDISTGIEDRTYRRQRDARADQKWQMELAQYASTLSQQEREAQAAQVESAVKMGLAAQSPQEWDALVAQSGAPDLVGQFGNREALAQQYMTVAEILKRGAGPEFRAISGADAAAMGLDPSKAYNVGADGKITQIGGGGVTVNMGSEVGTIPPGWELVNDPQTGARSMRPIAGGPAAQEVAAAEAAQSGRAQQEQRYGKIVLEDIGTVLAAVDATPSLVAGPLGALLSNVSGTGAHDVSQMLGTIRANVGFDRLQAMRAASPTGGALGAVSDTENKMLQSTLGALEQSQTPAQFARNLRRLQNLYTEIVHGPAPQGVSDDAWVAQAWGQPDAPAQQAPTTAQRRRYNPQTGEFE